MLMNGIKNLNPQVLDEVEKALQEKFGRSVNVKSTQILGGGCINHALKIETQVGNFFLKWNDSGNVDVFEKEAEGLLALKKAAGEILKIPEVVGFAGIDETPGFLLLEYLEPSGGNLKSDEKLGRGLALIHRNSAKQFGFYADNYCGATLQNNQWKANWAEFYRDNRLGFLLEQIQSARPILPDDRQLFEKLLEKLTDLLPLDAFPSLIHGDLWSGNYMNTIHGSALIDPAISFSDREMEFGMITLFGGFSERFFDAYNEENPLPLDWKQRKQLYQLYHLLNHYLLFGGSYLSQAKLIVRGYL
jgi:fructosamine-3-kinase